MPRPETMGDEAALYDIVDTAREIIGFTVGIEERDFQADRRTQLAILHLFAILGEAVKLLSPTFREEHAEVTWRDIAGMRDKLIHDYRGVNLHRVWAAATEDIPLLLSATEAWLDELMNRDKPSQ